MKYIYLLRFYFLFRHYGQLAHMYACGVFYFYSFLFNLLLFVFFELSPKIVFVANAVVNRRNKIESVCNYNMNKSNLLFNFWAFCILCASLFLFQHLGNKRQIKNFYSIFVKSSDVVQSWNGSVNLKIWQGKMNIIFKKEGKTYACVLQLTKLLLKTHLLKYFVYTLRFSGNTLTYGAKHVIPRKNKKKTYRWKNLNLNQGKHTDPKKILLNTRLNAKLGSQLENLLQFMISKINEIKKKERLSEKKATAKRQNSCIEYCLDAQ